MMRRNVFVDDAMSYDAKALRRPPIGRSDAQGEAGNN